METWIFYIVLTGMIVVLFRRTIRPRVVFCAEHKTLDSNVVAVFFLLLFIAVFREIGDGIGGTDAESYLEWFRNAGNLNEYLSSVNIFNVLHIDEPLFKIFNMIVHSITTNEYSYLAITYGMIIIGLIKFVTFFYDKNSLYFSLILFASAYLYSFNIMRTWMSIAICVVAFESIIYNKWIKSLLLIIIAGLIHTIAFSFVLIWIICLFYKRCAPVFSKSFLFIIVIMMNLVCYLAKTVIFSFVMSTKYSYYRNLFSGHVSIWGYLPSMLVCVVAILLFDRVKNDSKLNEIERRKKVYCILALTANLSCMYLITEMLAWRINDYYMLIRMYMISMVYEYALKDLSINRRIVVVGTYTFTMAHYIQQMMALKDSSGIFPYVFSFGNKL